MGFATHLGPWRLGTVKATSASATKNLGLATCVQTFQRNYATITTAGVADVIAVLPAGSQIVDIKVDTLSAFTGSTAANLVIGDGSTTNLYWASTDITTQGRLAYTGAAAKLVNWAGATSATAPAGIGIGAVDVNVTATLTPTVSTVTVGLVQYTVFYTVRASNGAVDPASA